MLLKPNKTSHKEWKYIIVSLPNGFLCQGLLPTLNLLICIHELKRVSMVWLSGYIAGLVVGGVPFSWIFKHCLESWFP